MQKMHSMGVGDRNYNFCMMKQRKAIVLALDLEGTLISNAVSQFPRPGLYSFLEYCDRNFSRIVIFTAVSEPCFRQVASTLVASGIAENNLKLIVYDIDLEEIVEWKN